MSYFEFLVTSTQAVFQIQGRSSHIRVCYLYGFLNSFLCCSLGSLHGSQVPLYALTFSNNGTRAELKCVSVDGTEVWIVIVSLWEGSRQLGTWRSMSQKCPHVTRVDEVMFDGSFLKTIVRYEDYVTFIERFVHFFCLKSHEPMSLFLTVGRHD